MSLYHDFKRITNIPEVTKDSSVSPSSVNFSTAILVRRDIPKQWWSWCFHWLISNFHKCKHSQWKLSFPNYRYFLRQESLFPQNRSTPRKRFKHNSPQQIRWVINGWIWSAYFNRGMQLLWYHQQILNSVWVFFSLTMVQIPTAFISFIFFHSDNWDWWTFKKVKKQRKFSIRKKQ